ncbi:hypothetical protein CEXT_700281 [Caerostris extrusa]|uniref:Uncharacterized protein n=1 Tax=Caerostris extrusa TaxID=172846 RepID=A0AAV4UKX9_CAEEX|nr:hypothetical protein CEXT_700281 [Caerostris extrusa]
MKQSRLLCTEMKWGKVVRESKAGCYGNTLRYTSKRSKLGGGGGEGEEGWWGCRLQNNTAPESLCDSTGIRSRWLMVGGWNYALPW